MSKDKQYGHTAKFHLIGKQRTAADKIYSFLSLSYSMKQRSSVICLEQVIRGSSSSLRESNWPVCLFNISPR
jgi:hypothetical protein